MPDTSSTPKLSLCITTFNRAKFIGETLESILAQATSECEVVLLDGGSTDDTERVVSSYARRFDRLRYFRQQENNGFDRDCDRVVELAKGEYCWLMTDDDIIKPGAVSAVLEALHRDLSLIFLNVEVRDFHMANVLQRQWVRLESDRTYSSADMDRLFVDRGDSLKYVGGIIIKRTIWLARSKAAYFGSMFVFLGVIFQARLPGDAMIIAEPLISYRMGNEHTYSPKMFETHMVKFPSVVWSLALSERAKRSICDAEPWRDRRELFLWRGRGLYTWHEYREWILPGRSVRDTWILGVIALLPGSLVNALLLFYYAVIGRPYRGIWEPALILQTLRQSPFYIRNWRVFNDSDYIPRF